MERMIFYLLVHFYPQSNEKKRVSKVILPYNNTWYIARTQEKPAIFFLIMNIPVVLRIKLNSQAPKAIFRHFGPHILHYIHLTMPL